MVAPASGRSTSSRYDSASILFGLLRASTQTSQTELARQSGLSKATVSEAMGLLTEKGFIREVGKRQQGRGRSQIVIELEATARYALGAQLDDHCCTVILSDLRAQPVQRASRPIEGSEPEDFIAALCACVEELRATADAPILGLGIGAPGSVDPSGRVVTVSVPFGWRNVPLADLVEERLHLPVITANRAKVAALGELWQGDHAGISHLVYVFVGEGIVAGLIIHDSLYFGSAGGAGEIGHLTVLPDGPICGCGNAGCLHMLASESAIIRSARTRTRDAQQPSLLTTLADQQLHQITIPLLATAVQQGDDLARTVVEEAGTYLGLALANVINLINPQRIVLGGPVIQLGVPLLEAVQREIRRRALWDALAQLSIMPSQLGDEAGAMGAAALILDNIVDFSRVLEATTA